MENFSARCKSVVNLMQTIHIIPYIVIISTHYITLCRANFYIYAVSHEFSKRLNKIYPCHAHAIKVSLSRRHREAKLWGIKDFITRKEKAACLALYVGTIFLQNNLVFIFQSSIISILKSTPLHKFNSPFLTGIKSLS